MTGTINVGDRVIVACAGPGCCEPVRTDEGHPGTVVAIGGVTDEQGPFPDSGYAVAVDAASIDWPVWTVTRDKLEAVL